MTKLFAYVGKLLTRNKARPVRSVDEIFENLDQLRDDAARLSDHHDRLNESKNAQAAALFAQAEDHRKRQLRAIRVADSVEELLKKS